MFSKIFLGLLLTCTISTAQNTTASLYDISLKDISGAPLDLSQYKGKKILFVNVASKCGFTSQYDALQELYKTYKDRLVVIACFFLFALFSKRRAIRVSAANPISCNIKKPRLRIYTSQHNSLLKTSSSSISNTKHPYLCTKNYAF